MAPCCSRRYLSLLLILVLLLPVFVGLYKLHSNVIDDPEGLTYIFKPGENAKDLAFDLYNLEIINHPNYLLWLLRSHDYARGLKAGVYHFEPGTSLWQIITKIEKGDVVAYQMTIVEGWTIYDLAEKIKSEPHLTHEVKNISKDLALKHTHAEGLFYPDTYTFAPYISDKELLTKAYEEMQLRLKNAWDGRDKSVPYKTPYEALIAASLIEKETSIPEERAIISGVIVRRLKKNMLLQIDASVHYGLGPHHEGQLTKQQLKTETPYNIYLKRGLPPTPIALPGEPSIIAALHPDKSTYLYFVAKGDGSHHFTSTLAAHNKAVKRYRQ